MMNFHPLFKKMALTIPTKSQELVFVRFSVYNADGGDSNGRTVPIAAYTAKLIFSISLQTTLGARCSLT